MKRRTFLTLTGGAAGAAVIAGPWIRRSRAATFGAFPAGSQAVQLPENLRAKRVLEVFLYGGVSTWETMYFVRDYGTASDPQFPNTQYYAYATSNATAIGTCGMMDMDRTVGADANGASVELGPFASRLWDRQDIVSRMRLVVQRHALEPHEAAVPMALTGRPVGQPNAAGLGAHIQRARLDAALTPDRASPHAYVLATGGISSDNVAAAASAGTHIGAARPVLIKTDNAATFTALLGRTTVGGIARNTTRSSPHIPISTTRASRGPSRAAYAACAPTTSRPRTRRRRSPTRSARCFPTICSRRSRARRAR